jgi:hypothetical protein
MRPKTYWIMLPTSRVSSNTSKSGCYFVQTRKIQVKFQVLTATNMKMAVSWDVAPCSLIDIDRRFRGVYCRLHNDDKYYWNVGQYLPDYTVQHPRRQPSLRKINLNLMPGNGAICRVKPLHRSESESEK